MTERRLQTIEEVIQPRRGVLVAAPYPTTHVPAEAIDHEHLRQRGVVAVDATLDRIRVDGRDRAKFLQGLVSNDVAALAPSEGCAAVLLNIKGKIQTPLRVLQREESLIASLPSGLGAPILALLDRYLIRIKATLIDESDEVAPIILAGPRAGAVLAALGLPAPLAVYHGAAGTLKGHHVDVIRADALEPRQSFEVWVCLDALGVCLDAIEEAVKAEGGAFVGDDVLEVARLEAGAPRFGVDMTTENLPLEARSEHLISFTKGCYLGQEIIARVDSRGAVSKHLVGLRLSGAAEVGAAIHAAEGKRQGAITTAGVSPTSGASLALGWVRRGAQSPGTLVRVEAAQGPIDAVVCALPFPEASDKHA